MPLSHFALELQRGRLLSGVSWDVVGACPTYNPLGRTLTFLSVDDVVSAVTRLRTP
jgi:hypothetical protein